MGSIKTIHVTYTCDICEEDIETHHEREPYHIGIGYKRKHICQNCRDKIIEEK